MKSVVKQLHALVGGHWKHVGTRKWADGDGRVFRDVMTSHPGYKWVESYCLVGLECPRKDMVIVDGKLKELPPPDLG